MAMISSQLVRLPRLNDTLIHVLNLVVIDGELYGLSQASEAS